MRVLLAGNPNCGKTTLFNRLTGSRARAGNRLGLTVEVQSAPLSGGGAEIWDLPGLYRLGGGGADEEIAATAIRSAGCDLIVNVLDATRLSGSFYLTAQLMEIGLPMVLALNLADEAARQGVRLDTSALSRLTGLPVVLTSAATGQGLEQLKAAIRAGGRTPVHLHGDAPKGRQQTPERLLSVTVQDRGRTGRYAPDRMLLHPFLGVPVFLLIMMIVFLLSFGSLGRLLSDWLQALLLVRLLPMLQIALSGLPPFFAGLLADGLWTGVCGVCGFLPQITLLTAFLTLLEDAGVLSRAAFLFDGLLRKLGLSGTAIVPLLLGFGCSVPAVMACRSLGSIRERERAMWLIPFVPCAAKLPVFLLVCKLAFPRSPGTALFLVYLASLLCAVLSGLLTGRRSRESGAFLLELPPYRVPALRNILPAVFSRVTHFLVRAGTAIVLLSVLTYTLSHLTLGGVFTPDSAGSLLSESAALLTPAFSAFGVAEPRLITALLAGMFAKEAAAAALIILPAAALPAGTAVCFLILFSAGPPCTAALFTMEAESRSRTRFLLLLLARCLFCLALAAIVHLLFVYLRLPYFSCMIKV